MTMKAKNTILNVVPLSQGIERGCECGGDGQGTAVDLTPYAKKEELPTKVSQLENDSGFVTDATPSVPILETQIAGDTVWKKPGMFPKRQILLLNNINEIQLHYANIYFGGDVVGQHDVSLPGIKTYVIADLVGLHVEGEDDMMVFENKTYAFYNVTVYHVESKEVASKLVKVISPLDGYSSIMLFGVENWLSNENGITDIRTEDYIQFEMAFEDGYKFPNF